MDTLSPTAVNGSTALLWGRTAAEDFCRQLPAHDPVTAQKLLCGELQRLVPDRPPELHQLGAVLTLDRHALPIGRRLALRYVEGDAGMRVLDRRALSAALRLCQSFAAVYAHMLRHIEQSEDEAWRALAATVLVQLFRHRQQELLLRLFRYKKRNSEQWRELNDAYRFALASGITRVRPGDGPFGELPGGPRTLEREFVAILLLDVLNTGQFSPRELLRASGLIARGSAGIGLEPTASAALASGFVVDLDGTEGLKRAAADHGGTLLHLDTAPLLRALDSEVAAAADHAVGSPIAAAQPLHDPLLPRLRHAWSAAPVHVRRRGERVPVDQTVVMVTGIASIVHLLRLEAQRKATGRSAGLAPLDGMTIAPAADLGLTTLARATETGAGPATRQGAVPRSWQVKDRSDTGCRMRGQAEDLNALIPGALVALAGSDNGPWTVAVVRRLRRLMVDHVEVSVEYIGRRPRFVKVAMGSPEHAATGAVSAARCFGALYLPASDEHPRMPIKTLLVPARAYTPGARVTLLASSATYALELNRPLQQHADFVWTSFSVLDRAAA